MLATKKPRRVQLTYNSTRDGASKILGKIGGGVLTANVLLTKQ